MCKEIIVEHFASECCKPKQIYLMASTCDEISGDWTTQRES